LLVRAIRCSILFSDLQSALTLLASTLKLALKMIVKASLAFLFVWGIEEAISLSDQLELGIKSSPLLLVSIGSKQYLHPYSLPIMENSLKHESIITFQQ
jgi:hypothetical protein